MQEIWKGRMTTTVLLGTIDMIFIQALGPGEEKKRCHKDCCTTSKYNTAIQQQKSQQRSVLL